MRRVISSQGINLKMKDKVAVIQDLNSVLISMAVNNMNDERGHFQKGNKPEDEK
jgi:hypothetical protein